MGNPKEDQDSVQGSAISSTLLLGEDPLGLGGYPD